VLGTGAHCDERFGSHSRTLAQAIFNELAAREAAVAELAVPFLVGIVTV